MGLDPAVSWIQGIDGNAIQNTEGNSDGHIMVKDNPLFNFDSTASFSVSFLQAPDYNNGNFEGFVTRSTGSVLYEIFSIGKDFRFRLNDGSINVVYKIPDLSLYIAPNMWGHLTCVRDRGVDSIKIYVNGEFIGGAVDATVRTISAPDIPLIIQNRQTLTNPSTSKMDELKMFNYALSAEEIASMASSYGDLTDPKVIAHWKFDETTGWRANEEIGIADGILMGLDPADAWIPGLVGNALDFGADNDSGFVQIADRQVLNPDSSAGFSFSMLLKSDFNTETMVLSKGEWANNLYELAIKKTVVQFGIKSGNSWKYTEADFSPYLTPGAWVSIVVVRDHEEASLKVYFDGMLIQSVEDQVVGSISTTGYPLYIGRDFDGGRAYQGKIDDLIMYNYALSVDEVVTLAESYGFVVSVDDEREQIPTTYSLEQNYPNPFNPSTTIQFALPKAADVKLTVYNAIGQVVAELVNARFDGGYHRVNFDASNISSGIYFYRLEAGDFNNVQKMILLK